MRYLLRQMARAAWVLRYRMEAGAVIAAVGFGAFAGAYSAIDSLHATVVSMEARTNAADFEIRFGLTDRGDLPSFKGIAGVLDAEDRLMALGQVRLPNGRKVAALAIASDPDRPRPLNRLWLLAGALPAPGAQDAVLERACAAHHGVAVGERMKLTLGTRSVEVRVSGIGGSAEFPVEPINPNNFSPTKGMFCVLFGRLDLVQERIKTPVVNSVLFRLRPGTDLAAFRRALGERVEGRLKLFYAAARGERISYKFLDLYLGLLASFLPVIVLVLAVSALFLIFFVMLRWVVGERQAIGVFMGLGYGGRRIVPAALLPAAGMAGLACAVGFGVAQLALEGFGGNYARAIGMAEPELTLWATYLAVAVAGTISLVALAALVPVGWLLRLTPMAALREGPGGVAEDGVGWAGALVGPVWLRHAARNLLRSPLISLLTVLSVALCLGVAAGFSVTVTSFQRSAVEAYDRARFGAIVEFTYPQSAKTLARIEGVAPGRWTPFVRGMAQLRHGARSVDVLVLGWDPATRVRTLKFSAGRPLRPDDGHTVAVSRKLAAEQGLKVGQRVTIAAVGEPREAELVGIFHSSVPSEIHLPLGFAREAFGLGARASGLFLLGRAAPEGVKAALYRVPGVASVILTDDMTRAIIDGIRPVRNILDLGSTLAIVVSLLFVVASVSFTLMGRRGEYGTLRIIGVKDGRLILSMLSEVAVLGLAAAALSVPIGYGLGVYLNARLTAELFPVDTLPVLWDFTSVLVPAMLLMPLAAIMPIRAILRAPLPALLNERHFG